MNRSRSPRSSSPRAKKYGLTSPRVRKARMSYDEAFALTGRGKCSYLVLAASSLIFVHAIIEMVAIGYVITPAECDLHLTTVQKSMLNASVFMGIVLTCVMWGQLSDHFGRRLIILPAVFGAVITSFCSSLCSSFLPMFLLRFATGVLISASSATILVYLSELQTQKYRDTDISIALSAAQVAFVLLPGIAWAIIPAEWSIQIVMLIRPWRVFMWTWGVVGFSGACILIILPESPNFLLTKKGPTATLQVLAKIFAMNTKTSPDMFPVQAITFIRKDHTGNISAFIDDWAQLLKAPMRTCLIITHFCTFVAFALSNGFYIWMPEFINQMLSDMSRPYNICQIINEKYLKANEYLIRFSDPSLEAKPEDCKGLINTLLYPTALVMEIVFLIPYVLVNINIHYYDKRKLFAFVLIPCSISLVLSCLIPQITVATMLIVLGLCCGSSVAILSALTVDAFPTSLRALVMNTMYTAGHIGAIFGTCILNMMTGGWCYFFFFLIAVTVISSVFVLLKFWPDQNEVRSIMISREYHY